MGAGIIRHEPIRLKVVKVETNSFKRNTLMTVEELIELLGDVEDKSYNVEMLIEDPDDDMNTRIGSPTEIETNSLAQTVTIL